MNEADLCLDHANASQRVEMFPPLNAYACIILWLMSIAGLQRLQYWALRSNYARTDFLFT